MGSSLTPGYSEENERLAESYKRPIGRTGGWGFDGEDGGC